MFFKNIHYGLWENYTAFSDTVWHKFNKNEGLRVYGMEVTILKNLEAKQKFHTIPSLSL